MIDPSVYDVTNVQNTRQDDMLTTWSLKRLRSYPRSRKTKGRIRCWHAVVCLSLPCWKLPGLRPRPGPTCVPRSPQGRPAVHSSVLNSWQSWEQNFFQLKYSLRATPTAAATADAHSLSSHSFQNKSRASNMRRSQDIRWDSETERDDRKGRTFIVQDNARIPKIAMFQLLLLISKHFPACKKCWMFYGHVKKQNC